MPGCRAVRKNLVAWIDGELPARWTDRIHRHVAACAACAAEAQSLRAAVDWQRRALANAVDVGQFDAVPLQARLQRAVAAEADARARTWGWIFRPVAVSGGALALATILVFVLIGPPKAILISLGLQAPPAKVTRQPELFTEYPLIEHLDALENFDTVESVPLDLDDEQASQKG